MWATVIDHVRTKFTDDWLPCMRLQPAVDLSRATTVAAPRCTVCHTGFIRVNGDSNPLSLCLQCLMRREIFEKVKPCLPRSYRARNPMVWPFTDRSDVKVENEHRKNTREYMLPASINLKGLGGKGSKASAGAVAANKGTVAIESSSATTVATKESSDVKTRSAKSLRSSGLIVDNSTGNVNSTDLVVVEPPKWEGPVDWFQRFDELQYGEEDQFALGRGAGVKDLPLLPYLVAKGHLEDLERTIRACFNQADEADSLQILPRLLAMQAEAYKLLGMWPLALAIMLDRADILATLTGYENGATIDAVCHVASCLRKMSCGHLASMYIKSISRKLEQKYNSILSTSDSAHNWLELSKDLLAADR